MYETLTFTGGVHRSDEVREKWKAIAQEKGNEYVYSKLVEVDAFCKMCVSFYIEWSNIVWINCSSNIT